MSLLRSKSHMTTHAQSVATQPADLNFGTSILLKTFSHCVIESLVGWMQTDDSHGQELREKFLQIAAHNTPKKLHELKSVDDVDGWFHAVVAA